MAERIERLPRQGRRATPERPGEAQERSKVIPLAPRLVARAPTMLPRIRLEGLAGTPAPAPALAAWFASSSGEVYRQTGWGGPHRLLVKNHTRLDAVVTIASPGSLRRPCLSGWVRAGESTTVDRIAAGTYNVVFDLGVAWDGADFSREGRRLQFVDVLRFASTAPQAGSIRTGLEAVLQEAGHPRD